MISAFPTKCPILFCLERGREESTGKGRDEEGMTCTGRERKNLIIILRFEV